VSLQRYWSAFDAMGNPYESGTGVRRDWRVDHRAWQTKSWLLLAINFNELDGILFDWEIDWYQGGWFATTTAAWLARLISSVLGDAKAEEATTSRANVSLSARPRTTAVTVTSNS
jgi:hypothetical protein